MATITFTPTTWVDDTTPAITAAQLNRIEAAVDDVINAGGDLDLGSGALLSGTVRLDAGTALLPSLTFDLDDDTGIYRAATDDIAIATGGAERLRIVGSTHIRLGGATTGMPYINLVAGSATSPTYAFYANTDTGMYRKAANQLAFATAGTERIYIGTTHLNANGGTTGSAAIYAGDVGSVTLPAFTFSGDTNTGMYRAAADELALAVGGVMKAKWTATTVEMQEVYDNTGGTANVSVSASGVLTRDTSAAKYKTDIQPAYELADVDLEPAAFTSLFDGKRRFGLIADQVAEVLPDAAVYGPDGEVENFDFKAVLAVLLAKVKRLEGAA